MEQKTELCQCPYVKGHKVRFDRLEKHLLRCKVQHADMDFVICPFNILHHMPRHEFEMHEKICPDQWKISVIKSFSKEQGNYKIMKPPHRHGF